jgi:hypothetical protein
MKHRMGWAIGVVTLTCGVMFVTATADDGPDGHRVSARLNGLAESPVVSSPGRGRFSGVLKQEALEYTLTFDNLQAPITQGHIHIGQPDINGGIIVWLCGTASNPGPDGTQVCPQSGTISGTIVANNVQQITAQGIAAGEFNEFARLLRAGFGYANLHTQQSPAGEIRGQIRVRDRFDHHEDEPDAN